MSNRHYWPTEPGTYLVESVVGQVFAFTLGGNGEWMAGHDAKAMAYHGWLGVRTPFSEEAERAAFEAVFPLPQGHDEMDLHVQFEQWRAWLAAKRRERGL